MQRSAYQWQNSSFSITELMLTLANLTIPACRGYVQTGKIGRVIQERKQIELIVENYKLDSGAYPGYGRDY